MTENSGIEFGYNCKYFLPALGKCRRLIDDYRRRKELVEQRWLSTPDLLVYLKLPNEELVTQIISGEIKTKAQKDGKLAFCALTAWQYDDCFLASDGGTCLHFGRHGGIYGKYSENPNPHDSGVVRRQATEYPLGGFIGLQEGSEGSARGTDWTVLDQSTFLYG